MNTFTLLVCFIFVLAKCQNHDPKCYYRNFIVDTRGCPDGTLRYLPTICTGVVLQSENAVFSETIFNVSKGLLFRVSGFFEYLAHDTWDASIPYGLEVLGKNGEDKDWQVVSSIANGEVKIHCEKRKYLCNEADMLELETDFSAYKISWWLLPSEVKKYTGVIYLGLSFANCNTGTHVEFPNQNLKKNEEKKPLAKNLLLSAIPLMLVVLFGIFISIKKLRNEFRKKQESKFQILE